MILREIDRNAICTYIISFFLFMVVPCGKAVNGPACQSDSIAVLKRDARKSEQPEDWKKVIECAEAMRDTVEQGLAYVSYFQSLNNRNRESGFMEEVYPALDFLSATKQYDYYFALYNMLIDRLFSHRYYQRAQDEAECMYRQAKKSEQPLGMAMALRVQGQIYYKLSLYDKAYVSLQEGWELCPSYQKNLNTFTTAQSLCEWLMMSCIKTEAFDELLPLADCYGEMLTYWNEKGWQDPSGHYPVTHLSLRAIAFLMANRMSEAGDCLGKAREYIRPDFPARAYEHFYEACYLYMYKEEKYKEAVAYVDTLMETHRDYFPFFFNDMLAKAELLSLSGQPHESIGLYREYISASDSVAKIDIARQIEELRIQHQVEKTLQENQKKTRYLQLSLVIIALIVLLLFLSFLYVKKLNAKNRVLVDQLEEHDKWVSNFLPLSEKREEQVAEDTSGEVMQRLNRYMTDECPYLNTALDRKELAKVLQVSERVLANSIREKNGQTVLEYITMFRLENARHLLTSEESFTIKDIAEQCGFGTLRTFQRSFKEKYGMPPTRYREIANDKKIIEN